MNNLPTTWQVKPLGELLASLESGGRAKGGSVLYGIPSIGAEHLDDFGKLNFSSMKYVPKDYYYSMNTGKIFNGDILVVKDGATTGKVSFVDNDFPFQESAVNEHVFIVRTNKHLLDPQFAFYYLYSSNGKLQILTDFRGSAQGGISRGFVDKVHLPLPPLPIQKQIAEILEKADEAKQKRKEANKFTDEFLQSVFIEMFGDPVKNPKGWEVHSFNKLVEKFQYGTSVKSSPLGLPVLRIPNVVQGIVDLGDLKTVELSQKEEDSLVLNNGDILFVRTNGNPEFVGRCALFNLEDKYVFASYLIRAIVKKKNVNALFLVYLLGNSNYRNVIRSKCSTTAGQFNINTKGLGSLPIILPPLSLQQQFADIVNKTEGLKEKQKQSEQELENLFQSLMQKAFKGELNFS